MDKERHEPKHDRTKNKFFHKTSHNHLPPFEDKKFKKIVIPDLILAEQPFTISGWALIRVYDLKNEKERK